MNEKRNPTIKRLPKVDFEVSMIEATSKVLEVMNMKKSLVSKLNYTNEEIEQLATQILLRNLRRLDVLTDGEVVEYHGPQTEL